MQELEQYVTVTPEQAAIGFMPKALRLRGLYPVSPFFSYVPERPRSRSPITRSLSPRSPSFTSCGSAHSPQGASSRAAERGSNGMGPRRGSWDWSHLRRGEDDRERDVPWRNGGGADDERPNGRSADRRKAYQKPLDHVGSRSGDERGGGGEGMMRSNRDWHPRGSPQDLAFSSYRSMEDEFYVKEQMYKSERPPRPPYPRHDTKPKRRDYGEYHRGPRHPEMPEEPSRRSEDRRQSSPGRSRSKRTSKRHPGAEKQERENATETTVRHRGEHWAGSGLTSVWRPGRVSLLCFFTESFPFLGAPFERKVCIASGKQQVKRNS